MSEYSILRDPVWQFIGAIGAILAIVLSVLFYRRQRKRKSLSYDVLSSAPLLSVGEEIVGGDLRITYNRKPVKQAHLILVKLINSGNLPISSADYERPIHLSFGENSQILTSEIVRTDPPNLPASIFLKGNRLEVTPCLLNPTDSMTIKVLIAEYGNSVMVEGRVVGVKEIGKFTEGFNPFRILMGVGFLLMISAPVLDVAHRPIHPLSNYFMYAGIGITVASIILDMRRSRRKGRERTLE